MTDAQLETTTEVHCLQSKDQTVIFRIWPDTGFDFERNPFPDWDEVEVVWTGDSFPPFKELFGEHFWGPPDSIDADRVNAREMYADLIEAGYIRRLA